MARGDRESHIFQKIDKRYEEYEDKRHEDLRQNSRLLVLNKLTLQMPFVQEARFLEVLLRCVFLEWERTTKKHKAAVENMKQRLDSTELNSTEKPISKMNKEDLVGVAQTELGMVLAVDMDFEVLEEEPK